MRGGSGTQRTTLGPLRHSAVVRLCPGVPAPSGPPLRPLRRPVERNGGPGKGRNLRRRNRAPGLHAHGNASRQVVDGLRTEVCGQQKQSKDPHNNQHDPQYANYWAPLTCKRHSPPHPAQPRHTNDGAPRMRKRHQQEHRLQRPTERSDPTQHAKGRAGDCPGPCKGATTRRNVTQGGRGRLLSQVEEAVVGAGRAGGRVVPRQ